MDLRKYIGFKFEELKPILDDNMITYNVIEVWDNKKTKMGDEVRVINIKEDNGIKILVSYF